MTKEIKEYKLENIDIAKLKGDGENPNVVTEDQLEAMRYSMERFGYLAPVVVDQDYIIADGEHRVKIYKEFGKKTIPVYVVECKTSADRKLIRQVMNKLRGEHDILKDAREIERILKEFDMGEITNLLAQDEKELNKILDALAKEKGLSEDFDPDEAYEAIKEPQTAKGAIILLGNHHLMCGDSTKKEDVEKLMDGKKADMVFTDPPYNVDYIGKTKDALKIKNDSQDIGQFKQFLHTSLTNMYNHTQDLCSIYLCHADSLGHIFRNVFLEVGWGLRQCIIWNKSQFVMGRQDYHWKHEPILYGWKEGKTHQWYGGRTDSTVWDISKPTASIEHPTMKPVELGLRAIKNSSTRGNIVLDLFGGSGSTLIACEQLNRHCYMMEIDPTYCDVIIQRWEKLTGGKATLLHNTAQNGKKKPSGKGEATTQNI